MGSNYDLSTYSRDGCVVDYAKLPLEVAWGQATLNPTAVMESKRVSLPVWTKARSQRPASQVTGASKLSDRSDLPSASRLLTPAPNHDRTRPLHPDLRRGGAHAPGRGPRHRPAGPAGEAEPGEGRGLRVRRAADRHRVGAVRPAVLRRRAAVRDLRRGDWRSSSRGRWCSARANRAADESQPVAGATERPRRPADLPGTAGVAPARRRRSRRREVAGLGRVRRTSWCSSACCWSASPTCGGAATWNGCAARRRRSNTDPKPARVRERRVRSIPMGLLEGTMEDGFMVTNLEWAINWGASRACGR